MYSTKNIQVLVFIIMGAMAGLLVAKTFAKLNDTGTPPSEVGRSSAKASKASQHFQQTSFSDVLGALETIDEYSYSDLVELAGAAEDLLLVQLESAHQGELVAGHAAYSGESVPLGTGSRFTFEAVHHIPGEGFYITALEPVDHADLYNLREGIRALNRMIEEFDSISLSTTKDLGRR